MADLPRDRTVLGFPVVEDPDLSPDVFWVIDVEGVPLGVGQVPETADQPDGEGRS